MKNKNNREEHYTSTEELVTQYYEATNPVTKASIRSIIANRLEITERHEMVRRSLLVSIKEHMERLTYSFDSRKNMFEYFKKYHRVD